MASLAKRPNGKWRARVTGPDGKQRARHFDRKVDAEEWIAEQVVKLRDGRWVDPRRGRRTFGEYVRDWQSAQVHHRPSTAASTADRLRLHLLPRFGDVPLIAIQRSDAQAWVKALSAQGLAPSYVEGLYRLLAQVLLAAVDDGVLATSPLGRGKVKLPERVRPPLVIPTLDEVRALVDAASDAGRPLILMGAGTGMRIGELSGLTVDRVDFLRRHVRVDRQLLTPKGQHPHFGPPKSKASTRTIPIPAELAELLAAHVRGMDRDGFVFPNTRGGPWTRSVLSKEWDRWRRKAGVGFNPHDLRHFYASSLIAAGQSVKVIQSRLGHATAQETLDTYGHLWHDDEDRTRDITGGVLRAVIGDENGTVEGLESRNPMSEG